jgi:hypothetical protein
MLRKKISLETDLTKLLQILFLAGNTRLELKLWKQNGFLVKYDLSAVLFVIRRRMLQLGTTSFYLFNGEKTQHN